MARQSFPPAPALFQLIFYGVKYESQNPFVLVLGDVGKVPVPLVRVHSACFTGDVLGFASTRAIVWLN